MILYYIILFYIILYYIILYYIILYDIILYYFILYYIILYYIILHYIILYYIIYIYWVCVKNPTSATKYIGNMSKLIWALPMTLRHEAPAQLPNGPAPPSASPF